MLGFHFSTMQVVDVQTGDLLGPNKEGEVCMRGPTIMKGQFVLSRWILPVARCLLWTDMS